MLVALLTIAASLITAPVDSAPLPHSFTPGPLLLEGAGKGGGGGGGCFAPAEDGPNGAPQQGGP